MTALQFIIKEAKIIRKKYPNKEWKECVAQASAIYASKHKGKSPVGKKKAVKKVAKKKIVKKKVAKKKVSRKKIGNYKEVISKGKEYLQKGANYAQKKLTMQTGRALFISNGGKCLIDYVLMELERRGCSQWDQLIMGPTKPNLI